MSLWRCAIAVVLLGVLTAAFADERKTPLTGTPPGQLIAAVKRNGQLRVIVGAYDPAWQPEGKLAPAERLEQRRRARQKIDTVLQGHRSLKEDRISRFDTVPGFVTEVHEQELFDLLNDDLVSTIEEDLEGELQLKESTGVIGSDLVRDAQPGYRGSGQIIQASARAERPG